MAYDPKGGRAIPVQFIESSQLSINAGPYVLDKGPRITLYSELPVGGMSFDVITVDAVNPGADYDNLVDALDNVGNLGTIIVGPGQYTLDEYILNKSVYIFGTGTWSTYIENANPASTHLINFASFGEVFFARDISFSCYSTDVDPDVSVFYATASSNYIDLVNCTVETRNSGATTNNAYIIRSASGAISYDIYVNGGFYRCNTGVTDIQQFADSNGRVFLYGLPQLHNFEDGVGGDSDSGGLYVEDTGTDVQLKNAVSGATISETGLNLNGGQLESAELINYNEEAVEANIATTYVIDLTNGNNFVLTQTDDTTLTFPSGLISGKIYSFTLIAIQDGTGGHTLTWPGAALWPNGVAPTQTLAANAIDVYQFFTYDGGTTWLGAQSGADFS